MSRRGPGLVAIYRWRVDAASEATFRENWREATGRLQEAGGFGSLLGRSQDGDLVAIALWPDAATRAAAFAASEAGSSSWSAEGPQETLLLEPLDDLWDLDAWRG